MGLGLDVVATRDGYGHLLWLLRENHNNDDHDDEAEIDCRGLFD